MSYTPTNWGTGDTITATKLNKMEQGIAEIGNGAMIITDTNGTLDKTYAEIYDLVLSGTPCYIFYGGGASGDLDTTYNYNMGLFPVVGVFKYNEDYRIYAKAIRNNSTSGIYYIGESAIWTYQVSTSTDYPSFLRSTYPTNFEASTNHNM